MICNDCGTCDGCGTDTDTDAQVAVGTSSNHPSHHLEHGFKRFWRPAAGYIYLFICVFDFFGAPLWVEYANQQVNKEAFAEIRAFEDKEVQMAAIEHISLGAREWKPLTLMGGAFFHIAFGAILGVAAFSRGKEKVAAIEGVDPVPTAKPSRRRVNVSVTDGDEDAPAPRLSDLE